MQNILLGITGGIAAYKSVLLARELVRQGNRVRCVLTEAATTFVSAQTLQALTGYPARSALFDATAEAAMSHIELARWADVLLIAPATANTLAKLAHGLADDLLSTLYLATTAKVVIAPAMNHQMWNHPATQANITILKQRANHQILPVVSGAQACGETGPGRMLEPEDIVASILTSQDWAGKTLTLTAGPTREAIDPVRYLSNHSSGKMGYALARAAANRGANVTLISGPTALEPPANCTVIPVTSAEEMYAHALQEAPKSDVFIAAAAVSDYRIANPHPQKQKKTADLPLALTLVENPDIVASVAGLPQNMRPALVVGFAAETENLLTYAREKRQRKNLDLIIANDVSEDVFASDENAVTLITSGEEFSLPRQAKSALAETILDHLLDLQKDTNARH